MKIKDIANLAGVSVATVSRVLNNKQDVNENTRKRILKIIKENDYKPNVLARNLIKQETNTIGVIIPDIKNLYFGNIINEIVDVASKKGLNVILGCSKESFRLQRKYIDIFMEQRVKGIIIIISKNSNDKIDYFKEICKKVPLIFVDRKLNNSFSGVYFDNINSSYNSVEKMIKKGAKNIAIITGPMDLSTSYERLQGYKNALKDYKISLNENIIYNGDYTLDSGYILGKEILKSNVDAVYISNSLMTIGFLKALKENKIKPKKFLISTFEDNEISNFIYKDISSYIIPFDELSNLAIELLEKVSKNLNYKEIIEIKPI